MGGGQKCSSVGPASRLAVPALLALNVGGWPWPRRGQGMNLVWDSYALSTVLRVLIGYPGLHNCSPKVFLSVVEGHLFTVS